MVSRSNKGIELGLSGFGKLPRLIDSQTRILLSSAPVRIRSSTPPAQQSHETEDFLPLPSTKRHAQKNYRSTTADSEESSSSTESSDNDEVVLSAHQTILKDLEQRLTTNPSSETLWLALLSRTLSAIPIHSKNSSTVRAEITISIISRAFATSPVNRASKLLRLKYLKAGEHVWSEVRLSEEWEGAFNSGGLWLEWLEWMTRTGKEGLPGVFDAAKRVLDATDDEFIKLRVFWRVSIACNQAGFWERAMAMFQAQAELTFNVPESFKGLPLDTQLAKLQEFWDTELPRCGEPGAQGWAHWVSSGCPQVASNSDKSQRSDIAGLEDSDPYSLWAQRERQGRTFPNRDDPHDPDPYSIVIFSDIQSMLLLLHSESVKLAFRTVWLAFLGLSVPGFSESLSAELECNWDDRWNAIHLIRPAYLDRILPLDLTQKMITSRALAGVIIGAELENRVGFGPVKNWGFNVLRPLDSLGGLWKEHDTQGLDLKVIREVFAQLRSGDQDHQWDLLSLAFEAAVDIKSAIKVSRTFLSTAPDSLARWAAHASLERLRGRTGDARRVYETVLTSSTSVPDACYLWWQWAEMEWLLRDSEAALSVIVRATEGKAREGVAILRAKKSLEDQAQRATVWKERECWVKMLALLSLLVSKDVSTLCDIFDVWMKDYQLGTLPHESMLTASLLLLHQHAHVLKNATQGSILRKRAEGAFEVYPSSSVILGIFLEAERGRSIWGQVQRQVFGDDGHTNVYRKAEQVWVPNWNKPRWGMDIERIRTILSTAVDDERTRGSPIILRLFLEVEIRSEHLTDAKRVLFRAIAECPLVKDFYLLAFGPLRSVFKNSELHALADTMVERGLRLRQALDEVVKVVNDVGDDEDIPILEDEIELEAREYRRLRPY